MKFISGLADCHLPGLYSLVLADRESASVGMRRVFYCGPYCNMGLWDGADFRLKPHNHRQSIRLSLLFGEAHNVQLKTGFGDMRVWCYQFRSALLEGKFKLEKMFCADAYTVSQPILRDGIHLHWSDIHTVTARRGSAWLVEELDLAPPYTARCWSVNHQLELNETGLYRPMGDAELGQMERHFEEQLCLRVTY